MNTIVLKDGTIIENVDSIEERYAAGRVTELSITILATNIQDLAADLTDENIKQIAVKDADGNVVDTFSYNTLMRLSKYIRGADVRINATLE